MNLKIRGSLAGAALGCALLLSMGAAQEIHARAASETAAQERNAQMASRPAALQARAATYDAKRETFLEGTVVAYNENAQVAPTGAHATLRTNTGEIDVHLGPASYLQSKHFSLAAGDAARFAGANAVINGRNVFLARTAQRGNQIIAIRSPRGSLLANGAVRMLPEAERAQMKRQGGAR